MKSFRSEFENPVVEKEIIELEKKIRAFREGKLDSDKFRSLRLARGVYGQRQPGVQMVRIKLPFGRLTAKQLLRIAAISDEYSTGNLHLTTRQDIQIHYVSLDRTPELWAKLAEDDITIREACGNTVRNITGSPAAGIDPKEPFDVTPYAYAMFKYLLRRPVNQELGRKFKISFSSSDDDTSYSFLNDLGFIPKIKIVDGKEVRGFKVVICGGLGAQPMLAKLAYEFLEEDQIVPFAEAWLRVFDRYGERTNRNKARSKYLMAKIGTEQLMQYIADEHKALNVKTYKIERDIAAFAVQEKQTTFPELKVEDDKKYQAWLKTNVFEQKQKGYYGVYIKIVLGNFSSDTARLLAPIVEQYAADDIRVTLNQGLLLRFVPKDALPAIFQELNKLNFAEPGFDSVADVTACPGTDTCNLGISNSTHISKEFERVVTEEYPELIFNNDIKIKISGCMNSCGQHALAHIGFHGSSFKKGNAVIPALQLLLGGGGIGNGEGRIADKIIKFPSKRSPAVLRTLLDDYEQNAAEGEYFYGYYDRKGKDYFFQLLKIHGDNTTVIPEEYIDWGQTEQYKTAIGVGECAGVIVDLVAILLVDVEEKINWAEETLSAKLYADSIYHSYSSMINTAKALLLDKSVPTNTQMGIINDFDKHFVDTKEFKMEGTFKEFVLRINKNEPSEAFAEQFLRDAEKFLVQAKMHREALQKVSTNG